jgi:Mg-chelatase subunit ChlD
VNWIQRLLILVFLASGALPAQDLRVGPIYARGSGQVEALIELRGSLKTSSIPEKALDPSLLTLLEDGKPTGKALALKPFSETGEPMAILLAADVSGSMAGRPLEVTKEGLLAVIHGLSTKDQVSLVSFADDVRIEAGFSAKRDQLTAAISNLATRGRITELYKALNLCMAHFDAQGLPRRMRLVILTDGKDEGMGYTLDDAITKAHARGIPVDTIGLSQVDPKFLSICERLADLTGGRYANAQQEEDLPGIMRARIRSLHQTPVARFELQNTVADDVPHQLGARYQMGEKTLEHQVTMVLPSHGQSIARAKFVLFLDHNAWPLVAVLVAGLGAWVWFWRRRRSVSASTEQPEEGDPVQTEPARPLPFSSASALPDLPREVLVLVPESPRPARKTVFQSDFRCEAPAPGRPSILLKANSGPMIGRTFPVESDPCWIGSEEDAAVRIPEDSFLSGFHAYIRFDQGLLYLFDHQSTNGTFKNDQRLGETSVLISPGDQLRLGKTVFSVEIP